VARYQDVVRVSREVKLFRSSPHPFFEANLDFAAPSRFGGIMCMDGSAHHSLRASLAPAFRPAALQDLAGTLRGLVREFVDRASERGAHDIVPALARPLPTAAVLTLVGVPRRQWISVAALMEQAFGVETRDNADRLEATRLLMDWSVGLLTRPGDEDTAVSHLRRTLSALAAEDPREAAGHLLALLNAATGTTRNLIASSVVEMLARPGIWELLRLAPENIPAAVEELTRLTTPLLQLTRMVAEETSIAGVTVPAGDRVVLLYASANRDETVFESADDFRLGRPVSHLSFGGGGPHVCLGAPLARIELTILLKELIERFPRPRLLVPADQLEGLASSTLAGYRQVPVCWTSP